MERGKAFHGEQPAPCDAVALDRLHRVFRARRRVTAGGREHRAHGALVEAESCQHQDLHRSEDLAAIVARAAAAASPSPACGADTTRGPATTTRSHPPAPAKTPTHTPDC